MAQSTYCGRGIGLVGPVGLVRRGHKAPDTRSPVPLSVKFRKTPYISVPALLSVSAPRKALRRHAGLPRRLFEAGDLFRPEVGVDGLKDEGDAVEAGIVHDAFENGPAERAFAEAFVAVEMAGERGFRVVQVHPGEEVEADLPAKFFHRPVEAVAEEVVPGGEGVAGVEADADAAGAVDAGNEFADLFETVPEVRALTGGVLNDRDDFGHFVDRDADRFGDERETRVLGDLVDVAPGVEIELG